MILDFILELFHGNQDVYKRQLLHCADMEDDKAEVTASTMSKAIQIGKYFLAHSTYAYSMMGTDLAIQKAKFVRCV